MYNRLAFIGFIALVVILVSFRSVSSGHNGAPKQLETTASINHVANKKLTKAGHSSVVYERPQIVKDALRNGERIYYLGVGSNMLRSKVVNRGINGTKISIYSMRPAVAANYRLAFNMRGFPPIEPSMGGIEPAVGQTVHGALIELDASEYEKLWQSEGGLQPRPGYREVPITVTPYGQSQGPAVTAIALQVSEHMRLPRDAPPSRRYMDILLEGAKELELEPKYIDYLQSIPVANPSKPMQFLARKHLVFTGWLFRRNLRTVQTIISKMLWFVYQTELSSAGSRFHRCLHVLSEAAMMTTMLPGALFGTAIEGWRKLTGDTRSYMFGSVTKPVSKSPA